MAEKKFLELLAGAAASTDEFKSIVNGAFPVIAESWAGKNPFKKIIAAFISRSLKKSLSSPVKSAAVSGTDESSRENIRKFIEAVDFGEIKETVDGSGEKFTAMVKMVNEEMWRYPAKVICLLSLLPSAMNMTVSAAKETLAPVNNLAPDLLSDVVFSLIDDIDGKKIGSLINELSELVRKIHTGSALLGEPGKPQLPNTLSRLTRETISTVDVSLLIKAGKLLTEIKGQSELAIFDLLDQSPELSREYFQSSFVSISASIRKWSRRADAFERLFSDEETADEFIKGMAGIDAQELADTVNKLCGILNRVHDVSPGIIRNTLSQAINSIDAYEAGETVKWFCGDLVESIKPVASEVLPPVIRGIADLLRPDPSRDTGEIQEALDYLKSALHKGEAAV